MPEKKFLADREKALEDIFFEKENRKLLERMQAEQQRKEARAALAELTGIHDGELLDKLAALEIRPGSFAALALIPLVEVAWADGQIQDRERRAIFSAAEANGIARGSASFELLESWLTSRPDPRYLAAWGEYIVALCAELDERGRAALRREILDRARQIAAAAGGILGIGGRISQQEQRVLDELEKAFGA
jgi:hypothetical protein